MNTFFSHVWRSAALACAGAALAAPVIRAAGDDAPAQADAFPSFESYIKVSGQNPWVSGDHAAFATRTGVPTIGTGGIEDLFYSKDINDKNTVTVNAHAIGGAEDYLAKLTLENSDWGSIDIGYKRFRTFYDGVGGFFPLADQFQKWSPEALHVDRGAFWVELKLAKPDRPVVTVSYHNEVRTGMKNSTDWAAIVNPLAPVVAGAIVGTTLPANTPFTAPNVWQFDEHHQIIDASVVAPIGKTTETLKATVDVVDNDDGRSYVKYPNSNVIADPTVLVHDDEELRRSTSIRVTNLTETKFNDKFALDTGLSYAHLTSENGGNWITPTYSATLKGTYNAGTVLGIYGGSKLDDAVGNIFLKVTPSKDWLAELGYRQELQSIGSNGGFSTTTLATNATTTTGNITVANDLTYSHYTDHVSSPEVTLQYTGFDRLSLYGSFDKRINNGSQHWINPYAAVTTTGAGVVTTATAPIGSVFFQEANQDNDDVKIGANWNACTAFTFRAEIYRKDHQNRFVGANDIVGTASYGALYATGYQFTGVKLTVILKPSPAWSFTTRYQPQSGNMSVLGNTVTGGSSDEITSGKVRNQMLSETVNWTPTGRVYVQGNLNVVYNYIQTAYPVVVESLTTNIATPIQNANNNYITGSALCGFVVNKSTDATLQGFWSRANNYNAQIASGGQPFGAGYEEESVTAGLKHKFTDRLMGEGKLGYLHRTDDTTGGFTNYRGPLAYVALTYSL